MPAEELSFVVLLYSQVCEYILNANWKKVSFNFLNYTLNAALNLESQSHHVHGCEVEGGCCFYFCEARLPKEEIPANAVSQCRVRAV